MHTETRVNAALPAVGARFGAVLGSLQRTVGGTSSTHRIILADKEGTVVAMSEDAETAEREWNFLDDRIVPQLQVTLDALLEARPQ